MTAHVDGEYDEIKSGRLDVTYRLGDHELRAGYDRSVATSYTASSYAAGFIWVYSHATTSNSPVNPSCGVGSPASGDGLGNESYYVRKQCYTGSGTVEIEQEAFYLEDRWQISDNVLPFLGVRNDNFKNYAGSGEVYVKQSDQWAPRIGAA